MQWRFAVGFGVLACACGGSPPPRAKPAPKAVVSIATPEKRPATPAPVSDEDVKPPRDLGWLMRSRSPASVWPAFARLLPAAGGVHDVFSTPPDGMARYFLGETVAGAVDLDKSVDIVQVGWGDKRRLVVSLALIDLDAARDALADKFDLTPRDGALTLDPHKGGVFGKIGPDEACEIRAARGSARYRLICGPRDALPRYGPWVARELAPRPLPGKADLWVGAVDMPNGALMDQLATMATTSEQKLAELVKQAAKDFRYFGVGYTARGDGSLEATLDVGLAEPHNVIGTELIGQPGHAQPLSKTFFRLPADTGAALFSVGASPEKVHAQAGEFWDAVSKLAADELAPADVPRFKQGLSRLFLTGGPSIIAYGFDVDGARSVLHKTFKKKPAKPAALAKAVDALQGWILVEIDEPMARWRDGIRALDAIPFGDTPTAEVDKTDSTNKEVPVRAAERLPKGSLHIHNKTFQNTKYVLKPDEEPAIPYSSDYYMVPDGSRTWMIWAPSTRVALDKLHAVLGGKPAKTLAGRSDLRSLTKRQGNVLGFASPAAVTGMLLSSDTRSDVKQARYLLDVVATLPKRGATPIPFVATSATDPSGEAKYSFHASSVVPQSSLDEIVALVMAASP